MWRLWSGADMRLPQLVTDESRFRQLEQQCRRGCGELARRENTRSTATVVGVIAVATFGLLLFLGRAPVRRVIEVVFGTFVLFGVSAIGAGIMRGLDGSANDPEAVASPAPPPPIEPIAQAALPFELLELLCESIDVSADRIARSGTRQRSAAPFACDRRLSKVVRALVSCERPQAVRGISCPLIVTSPATTIP